MAWFSKDAQHWLKQQIPADIPADELKLIWNEAWREQRRSRRFKVLLFIFWPIFGGFAAVLAHDWFYLPWLGQWERVGKSIIIATTVTGPILAGTILYARSGIERRLRLIARARGHEICVDCGYCLRGLCNDVTHCPECGAAREPMPPRDGQ